MLNTTLGSQPNVSSNPTFPPIPLRHSGYRIARATRCDELQAISRRRYIIFAERMGVFPLNEQGFELDPFDMTAQHLYVSFAGIVVGSVRLVSTTDGPYPLELKGARFPTFLPRATTVEGSRFNAERIPEHDVAGDLMEAVFRWSQRHRVTHWVGLNNERSIHSLERQGWPVQRCGESLDIIGVPYCPYYMCLDDARRIFRQGRRSVH